MQYQMQLHAQQQAWWMQQRAQQMGPNGVPPTGVPPGAPPGPPSGPPQTPEDIRYALLSKCCIPLNVY